MAKGARQTGVQSIEVGFPLVDALAGQDRAMTLTALASATNMSASKAHKYLVSLSRVGLIEQDSESGRYDLGPSALRIGLSALRRVDVVTMATATMDRLSEELNLSTVMTVWAHGSPTVVAWRDNNRPISVNARVGSRLPVLTSANGGVFLAWLPDAVTRQSVADEIETAAARAAGFTSTMKVRELAESVREAGVAIVNGTMIPGIKSISCPVFNNDDSLIAALAIVGTQEEMDCRSEQDLIGTLRSAARTISARISGRSG